jgi:hypothetical protein
MRLAAALSGTLEDLLAAESKAAERAVSAGVRAASEGLKAELRSQVTGAGLGERLARTWRSDVYPRGQASTSAAALVWSKAPKILRAFDDGMVIRSSRGFFLAIPTPEAGRGLRGGRITPGEWERRTGQRLRFVYRRGVPSLLVADGMRARTGRRGGFGRAGAGALRSGRGLVTVPIFILLPQVSLRKRLDVDAAGKRWQARLPELVLAHWPTDDESR